MPVAKSTRWVRFALFLSLATIAALCGCEGPPPAADNPRAATTPQGSPQTSAPSPAGTQAAAITDAEAQEFAKSLETVLKSTDPAAINAVFDYDSTLARAMQDIDLPDAFKRQAIEASVRELNGPSGLGAALGQQVAQGARFRVLHVRRKDDQQRILLRKNILTGFDYMDMTLLRGGDGKMKIGDVFTYSAGQLMSEKLHQNALCMTAQQNPAARDRLSPADREYSTHLAAVNQMQQYRVAGKSKEALNVYQTFPEALKNHRLVLHEYIGACSGLGTECDEAIRAYRAACPDDPGTDLLVQDYYFVLKRYDELLTCVDRLDKAVGGDTHLDAIRAGVYLVKGDLAAAKKCADSAIAAEPDSQLAKNFLTQISLREKVSPAGQPATQPTGGPAAPDATPNLPPSQPASDEEAKAFAAAFAKSVLKNETEPVHAALDLSAMYRRAVAGVEIPQELRAEFESAFTGAGAQSLVAKFDVGDTFAKQGGNFRLLHLRRENGEQRALFRLVDPTGDVNYLDCTLVHCPDGKVRIDDVYLFDRGMSLSEMMHHTLALVSSMMPKTGQAPTVEGLDAMAKSAFPLKQMQAAAQAGRYQEVLDVYAGMPEGLQKEKMTLVMRLDAAKHVKGRPYDDAIKAYRKAFPNERNLDLILAEGYLEHKLYDRAMECIDRLDQSLGGDPYLNVLRAGVYLQKGDNAAAKASANKAIAAEPDLRAAYFSLISISLKEKKFAETSRLLTLVQDKVPGRMPEVATDPAYAQYVKSTQYRAWLRTQKR